MNSVNMGKLWITQNDGFTLASYNLVSLANNPVDTLNLRIAFGGIPNFPTSTWTNNSPCAFMPRAHVFVGWAEPGGSNHYTWYLAALAATPKRMIFINT
jgi:hypothetical protein